MRNKYVFLFFLLIFSACTRFKDEVPALKYTQQVTVENNFYGHGDCTVESPTYRYGQFGGDTIEGYVLFCIYSSGFRHTDYYSKNDIHIK